MAALWLLVLGSSVTAKYELWQGARSASAQRYGAALRHYESARLLDPDDAATHLSKAAVYWRAGQIDLAAGEWRDLLFRDPADAEALAGLGRVAFARREWGDAIDLFRSSLAKAENLTARSGLAESLAASGDLVSARAEWQKVIAEAGADKGMAQRASFWLGLLLLDDDAGAALESLRLAEMLDAGAVPQDLLAGTLQIAADLDRVQALSHASVAQQQAYRTALVGYALFAANLAGPASAVFERAITLLPDYADAHAYLGYARFLDGDHSGSLAAAERAIALAPGAPLPHYVLGIGLRALQRLDDALASLRMAAMLDPASSTLHLEVARTLVAAADYSGAADAYTEAARHAAEAAVATEIAAFYLDHLFRLGDGLAAAERGVALAPRSAGAYDSLGWARYLNGDIAGGKAALEKAVSLDGASAKAHLHLATLLEHQGDGNAARSEYRRVLDLEVGPLAERAAVALAALTE